MSRREFQLTDGSSHKFWDIELDGASQTVRFGRVGTAGQSQTKEFPSEAEARKSTEKLIAEKVKKGYAEVTAGATGEATLDVAAKKPETKPKTKKAEAAVPEPVETPKSVPAITRVIDLEPHETPAYGLRSREPVATPEPAPFDLASCLARLRKVTVNRWGWNWDWSRAGILVSMSREEAQFWFAAMTGIGYEQITTMNSGDRSKELPKILAVQLESFKPNDSFSRTHAVTGLQKTPQMLSALIVLPLASLFSPTELLELMEENFVTAHYGWNDSIRGVLMDGFCRYVVPRLSPAEIQALEAKVRKSIDISNWPTDYYKRPPMEFFLAALIGMPGELLPVVQSLPDSKYVNTGWDHSHYHQTQRIIFGLGDPRLIETEMRRLRLPLRTPEYVRMWLAATQFAALEYLRDNILDETRKDECEALLNEFARVKAPEAAPLMLELKLGSRAPSVARQWLDEEAGNAIAGLLPTAAGRGKLAEAAVEYLREAKKKGHESFIRECLNGAAPEVAESVRKSVLDHTEKEYAVLDAGSMPDELKTAFAAKAKKGKIPAWAAVSALPPLLVADKKLGDEQAVLVLEALQRSTLDKPDPLVSALKKAGDPGSLDAFAWKLFQQWQGEGSPSKEKWAMAAVGLFGGDASALKLTPLVRNWPGESQHQRAVFGLECLRAIGSDTALMQLNGIAQKLKFKGLKEKAAQAMEAIATDKGLTRSQLEDRIVPDCDLDERGRREFDFGPRQFRFVLGPDMKPMLKDADGKVKTDLPKPGAKDDPAKAEQAVADWKLMKKQIKEVATIQAQRLEQAMVTGRRWTPADFETLIVRHPLMTNLARLVLWGGFDKAGKLALTFRVTEDQTYADAKDNECKLAGLESVGLVHPLHLTEDQKSAWGEVFSDYEIVPPFPQLGRTIYRLEKSETEAHEIKRFTDVKIPAPTLVFGLEKLGWIRGAGGDGGGFDEHSKPFPAADVTAVVRYDGGVGYGYIEPTSLLTFEQCYFVTGHRGPMGYAGKETTVRLADVDPVAVSEVLADLAAIAAKGT